jgi:23S rRNA pseudouridine1911/1915/1917 synthase
LTEQFREGTPEKTYWALVESPPEPPSGTLTHWLKKDEPNQRMAIVPPHTRSSLEARLSYDVKRTIQGRTLLEVRLHTGRKHQIRVQLAAIGCPILGDRKYGSRVAFPGGGIALHALRLSIDHPTTKERLTFEAPPPANWPIGRQGRAEK